MENMKNDEWNVVEEGQAKEGLAGEIQTEEIQVEEGQAIFPWREEIPGTAQIRKLGTLLTAMELLELSAKLAEEGYEKKLFSLLSRVYSDKKHFDEQYQEGMEVFVNKILTSAMPSELKMQTFTSFRLPASLIPEPEIVTHWIKECSVKRQNIAVYFLADYPMATRQYEDIIGNKTIFKMYLRQAKQLEVMHLYEEIFQKEEKEFITGAIRTLAAEKRRFRYPENGEIQRLTRIAFASKQVFFTTKLMYCITFDVPKDCLPGRHELYDILKICINYDETVTREFVGKYGITFNCSPEAMCKYYLGNKKSQKERALVQRFATALMQVEDEVAKSKLLHFAFKRGGLFRMYAGCMQDGGVDVEKQKRFHYTEDEINWCQNLPGLKK